MKKSIINLRRARFGARPKSLQVRPDNNVVASFEVLGETDKVDFYFISTVKEGIQHPLTTVMGQTNKNTIAFIDHTNSDYLGRVDYYAQAVFHNGTVSNLNFIGSCAILEKKFLE